MTIWRSCSEAIKADNNYDRPGGRDLAVHDASVFGPAYSPYQDTEPTHDPTRHLQLRAASAYN